MLRRRAQANIYLKGGRGFGDDFSGFLESTRGFLFSLGGDDFGAGFTGSLGLGSHGALQLHWQTNVLTVNKWRSLVGSRTSTRLQFLKVVIGIHFDTFDFNTPRVGGLVQWALHSVRDGFAFRQDFGQVLGTQDVTQRCGRQQTGRVAVGVTQQWESSQQLRKKTVSFQIVKDDIRIKGVFDFTSRERESSWRTLTQTTTYYFFHVLLYISCEKYSWNGQRRRDLVFVNRMPLRLARDIELRMHYVWKNTSVFVCVCVCVVDWRKCENESIDTMVSIIKKNKIKWRHGYIVW